MMMNSSKILNGRKAISLAVSVLALGVGGAAFAAGSASDNLAVSASIASNCTIDASAGLAFGAYDPIVANKSSDLTGDGSISVICTNGSAVTIELDGGQNEDGAAPAAPARRMADGANFLSYTLYSDAGLSTLWATGAAVDVDDTGTGVASSHTVYGSVAQDQNVPVGSYSDTVSATVTF
jgi:spore coat protein U-like protein